MSLMTHGHIVVLHGVDLLFSLGMTHAHVEKHCETKKK